MTCLSQPTTRHCPTVRIPPTTTPTKQQRRTEERNMRKLASRTSGERGPCLPSFTYTGSPCRQLSKRRWRLLLRQCQLTIDIKLHDVKGKNYRCAITKLNKEIAPEKCKVVVKPTKVVITLCRDSPDIWLHLNFKEDKPS